ncbi:hypothetical protein [Litorihabitans aurantiacus]|uniref:Uncharacterized protein n=1 Tax=Litorihabitans aurantiacus TaxID=1930061 RepID=A0AA37USA5_9MICO|nr:hypothetical protein [Litorihabitans aurantiacus]GMA31223.1 hypothetical protein GCM10025875_12150 [Litorihabitans aurantiacus]
MLVALPGEPFLETGDAVATGVLAAAEARADDVRAVVVAGYSGGTPGYLPTARAWPEGGYEVADAHRYYAMPAPFAPEAAAIVEREAVLACPIVR